MFPDLWRRPMVWRAWRCWIMGRRLHHGAFGLALVAVGLALVWHDRADYPWRMDLTLPDW